MLTYKNSGGIIAGNMQNMWESIMSVVVFAYELAAAPEKINSSLNEVYFIQQNCLNTILVALKEST